MGDLLYWGGGLKGRFTIKSAIEIIRDDDNMPADGSWELVWRLRVQQRVRVLLWLVLHDRLMHNVNRFKRDMTNEPKCKSCPDLDETMIHMLRDCKVAREVWRQVGGPANAPNFRSGGLKAWIVRNIKVQESNELSPEIWPTYFALVIWWLWRWRCNVSFERGNENPIDIRSFLLARFEETWRALGDFEQHPSAATGQRVEALIRWLAPPVGWLVLNTDGSAKGAPGPAGGGGLIRDCTGKLAYAFSLSLGNCNAFMAEVKALEYGLELAARLRPGNLQIQLDSQALVLSLKNPNHYVGEAVHNIASCKKILEENNWRFEIHHIYREANRAADWLANKGVSQNNAIELIQVPPLALGRILHDDVVGVALSRFVPP